MTDNMNLVKDAFRNFLSEYQTEKKDATLADLGTRVNRIVRDMARLNKLAEENAAELEEINKKRETYAAAVVDAELAEVRARQQARVQRFANDLLEAVVFVQNNIDAVTQNIPFDIAAPDFQAVLSVIFASGKHLPIEKQTDFIKQYRAIAPRFLS